MPFTSLGLPAPLLKVLADQHFTKPTPIQEKAIPAILAGRDVLGIAKTGSGKTASYVLPILTHLQDHPKGINRHVDVLVLVPTRELAKQVDEVFRQFGEMLPRRVKSLAVFGGVSINPQMIALQGVTVLVATPGRLLDLVESNAVYLSHVDTLVLDEADKMLTLGFEEEVERIFDLLPADRQNLLFSATLSDDVERMNTFLLHNPIVFHLEPESDTIDLIHQVAYWVPEEKKGPLLRYLIKSKDLKQVLVFTSSTRRADNVAFKLYKNGIDAVAIHGKMSQGARAAALHDFKSGRIRVLVATDLLSRGIDIESLPCVINYELPRSPKDYIHRIGRTGRAEVSGEAITLVTPKDEHHFKIIQKKTKQRVEMIDSEGIDLFAK